MCKMHKNLCERGVLCKFCTKNDELSEAFCRTSWNAVDWVKIPKKVPKVICFYIILLL